MTFAAITTLPKTTYNISTFDTGETSLNYSEKLSLSPHTSSLGNFSQLTQLIYSKSRIYTSGRKGDMERPPFQTIFY